MREIKFRAWNKVAQRMVTKLNLFAYIVNDDLSRNHFKLYKIYDKDIIIMQYTGLKDINGKEIYEGDIIKWGHINGYEENPHRIAIVEFNPDIQFNCINLEFIFRYGCFNYQNTDEAVEVIGNIYENPELIADNVEE